MLSQTNSSYILPDHDELTAWLIERGLGRAAAEPKAAMFLQAASHLPSETSPRLDGPPMAFFVPGRVEVLGKHTDYAGGSSIVAAIEYGFVAVARPRRDNVLRLSFVRRGGSVEIRLDDTSPPRSGHWGNYPAVVARRIARDFPGTTRGAEVAILSDLPPASGMSSSSALVVCTLLILSRANKLCERPDYRRHLPSRLALAGYAAAIEAGTSFSGFAAESGVGTHGGSEDHTAILCARPGELSQYAYCPARHERTIPLPPRFAFVLASSGVIAEKTGEARERYNRQSLLASALLGKWNRATGRQDESLAAALQSDADAPARLRQTVEVSSLDDFSSAELLRRLDHFLMENQQIIPAAADALADGDLMEFGKWVDASQLAAEELLGNQIPQTTALARAARECGAVAASSFGAGFGGSVWALVPSDEGEAFGRRWAEAYHERFPQQASRSRFLVSQLGPAAFSIR